MSKRKSIITQKERQTIIENAVSKNTAKRLTAKRYLGQLQRLNDSITQKQEERESLLLMASSFGGKGYDDVRVQSSGQPDKMAAKVISAVDLEKEISREIDEFLNKKHTIINQIQAMETDSHAELLYKRYVQYKSLEVISVEMSYTFDWIRHLHGMALQAFEFQYADVLAQESVYREKQNTQKHTEP